MSDKPKKEKVFVGLSGGVDSSVAALRLINSGYEVVGVFIKVWQPEFLRCDWETERLDAMRVAASLGIPFLTCDAEAAYKKEVGEYFVNEYLSGRTPNPDVMCNRHVKFGAFWEFAKAHGADSIATGHYAQAVKTEGGYELRRGMDEGKDQTYFLWTLTEEDLLHTLFPIGDTPKEEVRKEAKKAGLPTAGKKDSQGICFLGHVDIPDFLSHFTKLEKGEVRDTSGKVIGEHKGALIYTHGQRHGFTLFGETDASPSYVVAKDLESNTIIVDDEPPIMVENSTIELGSLNLIGDLPEDGLVGISFRYRQSPVSCKVVRRSDKLVVEFLEKADRPSPGQSAVLYIDQKCLGGGVIE